MKKINKNSLISKLIYRMIKDSFIGVLIFCILNGGGISVFREQLLAYGDLYGAEQDKIEAFQKYVSENQLKMTDTDEIRSWVRQRNIQEFVISKGKNIFFDNTYQEDLFPGAVQKSASKFLCSIYFSDGEAELYIYDGFADKYFDIISFFSAIISILICLAIFASELQKEIKNIKYLKKEVEEIGMGHLENAISITGEDEICGLATGIDHMRNQLILQKKTQEKMQQVQNELVLGMSHDLRTPLTGLFSYLEIIKKLEKEGKPAVEYAIKALNKAEQLRSVSDQLFEYFLVSNESDVKQEEPETVQSIFEDYLSEFCVFLQYNGFCIETERIKWKSVMVCINSDYLGRIMNNLISNIEKYAAKDKPIELEVLYTDTYVELGFRNKIIKPNPYVKGTGIGLKNIELMMEQMKGFSMVEIIEDIYYIKLSFLIAR